MTVSQNPDSGICNRHLCSDAVPPLQPIWILRNSAAPCSPCCPSLASRGQAEPPTARVFPCRLPKSHNQHVPSPWACCCDGGFLAACRQQVIATGKSRAKRLWDDNDTTAAAVSKCHWFPFWHVLLFALHLVKTKLNKKEIRRKHPNFQARKRVARRACYKSAGKTDETK